MKHMNNKWLHWSPWKGLQLFADGGDGNGSGEGGDGDGSGSGSEGGNDGNAGGEQGKTMSFDDFLKGEGNQAEFDRRVQKAINTAVTKAQEKWKALTDNKLSEAEKLAKMTKEEKTEYEMAKLKKQLADLQKQSNRSEMAKTARKILSDEVMKITRMVKKQNGTTLKTKKVSGTLQSGNAAEGDEIPLSQYTVEEIPFDTIKIEKYRKKSMI